MIQKHGLGRGLSSLIPQKNKSQETTFTRPVSQTQVTKPVSKSILKTKNSTETKDENVKNESRDFVKNVPVGMVRANTQQPRMYFDEEKLEGLTSSIRAHGILQPLVAVHNGDHYELIAGERRLRASKKAGLATVPVVVKNKEDFDDQKKLELALIENIQRHDLNLIEESRSYQRLAEEFDLSQEEIASRTGKSRSVIANRMRLLSLPIDIQKGVIVEKITEGHAKVIMSLTNPQKQMALYKLIVDDNLTVRQAENKLLTTQDGNKRRTMTDKTIHARRLEDQLTQYFNTKVRVSEKANGGSITVSYFSDDELKNILSRLKLS